MNESQLSAHSYALEEIARNIQSDPEVRYVSIDRKYTSYRRILVGITVDWNRTKNWDYYKRGIQHFVSALIMRISQPPVSINLYLQNYSFHPFIDVYAVECNKGKAFEAVVSEISTDSSQTSREENRRTNTIRAKDVLYLGDSENAFSSSYFYIYS